MNKNDIRIDRLEIRMRGVSQVSPDSIAGIGIELLEQLAKKQEILRGKRSDRIEKIDSGTMKVEKDASPSDLQRAVATRIADAVELRSKVTHEKKS